jgi:hypothetical protein
MRKEEKRDSRSANKCRQGGGGMSEEMLDGDSEMQNVQLHVLLHVKLDMLPIVPPPSEPDEAKHQFVGISLPFHLQGAVIVISTRTTPRPRFVVTVTFRDHLFVSPSIKSEDMTSERKQRPGERMHIQTKFQSD